MKNNLIVVTCILIILCSIKYLIQTKKPLTDLETKAQELDRIVKERYNK